MTGARVSGEGVTGEGVTGEGVTGASVTVRGAGVTGLGAMVRGLVVWRGLSITTQLAEPMVGVARGPLFDGALLRIATYVFLAGGGASVWVEEVDVATLRTIGSCAGIPAQVAARVRGPTAGGLRLLQNRQSLLAACCISFVAGYFLFQVVLLFLLILIQIVSFCL